MPVLSTSSTLKRTGLDFIKSGLRLVGALRSGLGLTADEQNDCQLVLNDLLDALSSESISIPATAIITKDQNGATLTLTPGQQSYTVGNANGNENFQMNRPPRIRRVSILYNASQSTPVELPMEMLDDVKWQGIANKSIQSILPQICFPDESNAVFPDSVLFFWPIPTQANPIIIYAPTILGSFADLTTPFLFPPAYSEMLRYNFAVRAAAEFPCDLQKFQIVSKLAVETKSRVTSSNIHVPEATCDEALVGSYGKMGNIFSDTANRAQKY